MDVQGSVYAFLKRLKKHGEADDIPNISFQTAKFLRDLIKENDYTSILEIGSANGFSTIHLIDATKQTKGKVQSIEFSRHAFEEAMININSYHKILHGAQEADFEPAHVGKKENSGINDFHEENVHLIFGNALQVLPTLSKQKYDFIFIDGMFKNTLKFFELCSPLLIPGGKIVVDDAIKYAWKMEGFFEFLEKNAIQHEIIKIDEDDGIMLISPE